MFVSSPSNLVLKLTLTVALAQSMAFRKDSRVFPLTVAGTPFAGVLHVMNWSGTSVSSNGDR
jgi:hypothetical protein